MDFGTIGTLGKHQHWQVRLHITSQRIWTKSKYTSTLSLVSGLVVCCFECNQRPKPVCCMNDKCGDRQLASPVEECTWTRTICWNYPLCTPAQLWMCEMVISAYAPPFVMLARFNRHMLVWVSMGRRWNATAGKKRPSLCLSFFSTKQAERLVSTRGVWLWYVLIFSRLTFQTCSIDQQQGRDHQTPHGDGRVWEYATSRTARVKTSVIFWRLLGLDEEYSDVV